MEQLDPSDKIFEKFTWKIRNFSQLKNVERIYSETFVLGGYQWRINLYPSLGDSLEIYLEAVQNKFDDISEIWYRDVKFNLTVFNQLYPNRTITQGEYKNEFSEGQHSWGYDSFMPLVDLHDPEKGFVVNDVCIVGVELFVRESTVENQMEQLASLARRTNEEVLNNDLQVSWEELKKYRADLIWLEPHVQSALEIRSYVDKALLVEKLKETEAALLLQTEKLKRKLTGTF